MHRKQLLGILCIIAFITLSATVTNKMNNGEKPEPIPAYQQQLGDAQKGYEYLVTGNYVSSGFPYKFYKLIAGKDNTNLLNRTGKNATVPFGFNVIKNEQGIDMVVPNCLQCHAQVFNNQLYVGLGNSFIDFSNTKKQSNIFTNTTFQLLKTIAPKQFEGTQTIVQSFKTVYPDLQTEVRGVNAADRLAILLVAHRNPVTLQWSDSALLKIPNEVIPTDAPAWWLLKKKNAMFYTGFGRGDFGKFLMLSNLLTVKDTSEAATVYQHFADVLAYIKTIEPPKYPKPINQSLAMEGQLLFTTKCSKCHGSYGADAYYPNLLIPEKIIGTDSLLYKSNQQNPQFIQWFNTSWFAGGGHPAKLVPYNGYIAPPLDGVWVTAPYFHNGSVPTLEGVLNSKKRPKYWSRNFKKPSYNYESVGWNYTEHQEANNKKIYNTTLPGYGNYGHNFGDELSEADRKAIIEYLKTL